MRKLLKKFKNFKLTALIEGIAGLVSGIATIVILVLYQTNLEYHYINKWTGEEKVLIETGFYGRPIEGMVFFLAALLALIFAIVVVYGAYPHLFKKDEKIEPNKMMPWFGVTCAAFSIVEFVYTVIMIGSPYSRHTAGILVAAIFLLLSVIVQLLMIIPSVLVEYNDK